MSKLVLEEFRRLAGLRTEAQIGGFRESKIRFDHLGGGLEVQVGMDGVQVTSFSSSKGITTIPLKMLPREDEAKLLAEAGKAVHALAHTFEQDVVRAVENVVKKYTK